MTRVGVVGSGFIARQHVRSWRPSGVEIALFSQDVDEARQLADRHGLRLCATLEELVATSDIVDVCTPTDQHGAIVATACAAGRDVVCEKPLARTAREAGELARLCESAGVRLFPAHVVRYVPAYAAARAEVERGGLGELAVAHLSRSGPRPSWSRWFQDPRRSGGILMDLMIHEYDIASWLCGPVDRVFARRIEGAEGKQVGMAMLTHRTGALSHVRGVWAAPGAPLVSDFRLYGSAGYVASSPDAGEEVVVRDESGAERRIPALEPGRIDPFALELADFLAASRAGREACVRAEDGVSAVRVAEAALRSAETGAAVELTEVTA